MNWGAVGGAVAGFLALLLVLALGYQPPDWFGGACVLAPAAVGGLLYPLWRYR